MDSNNTTLFHLSVYDSTTSTLIAQYPKSHPLLNLPSYKQSLQKTLLSVSRATHQQKQTHIISDEHKFHALVEPDFRLVVTCISNDAAKYRTVFSVLDAVRRETTRVAKAKSRVKSFMKKKMKAYSENASESQRHGEMLKNDKIYDINQNMSELRSQMISNIDKALQRGNEIDVLEEKTLLLVDSSKKTRRKATKLKRKMMWRWILIGFFCLALLALVLAIVSLALIAFLCVLPMTRAVEKPQDCLPWKWFG